MKTEIVITISNPYEAGRLLSLIKDGMSILNKQDRIQRGVDGYTNWDLKSWHTQIKSFTGDEHISKNVSPLKL